MATHREAPVLLGMPELVRRPLSAPAANKKKTQSLSASQRMSDELVKHVAAFNFGRNHLCTIYIEHCTRHRESFSLRGNLNKYEATAKWVVEQLLTHLGDGCKVNVHVNGITTREDFTLSVGERRWARMNDMSHEIHLGKLRPVMDGLWGKSETHRVPPSLKAIPGVHGAPSPSAELPRDFPRIGAFEVVLAITDCRLSDSAQPLFQALLCSKRDLTCWPSRDSLQSRLSKFMDRVGEALYLGTPPWPLGRAASSPDGPVAAPPPTSDEGKWMSLYHQFCHMEAHRNTWWLFDPLPMLADTENALDSVVSHSLKWSPRLGMTTLDTWRPEHLVRKALGSTELASDIAAILLRQLERRAQRVGQQCDAHLQYVFLRTIAVSGQSDDLVAALLRESPLELSGLVAKCLRDTIGPLNQSTNSSSIAAKVQDCVLDGARFFEVIEDDDKWPLLILSVFLSAPVELKIVLKGIFLFFKLSGSPLDAMELGVPELHIEAQGEEANRPLLRILFSISDDARRRTVLNLLKNAGADGFRTATQLPVDQRKPRYKIVEQKRDGEDQMKNASAMAFGSIADLHRGLPGLIGSPESVSSPEEWLQKMRHEHLLNGPSLWLARMAHLPKSWETAGRTSHPCVTTHTDKGSPSHYPHSHRNEQLLTRPSVNWESNQSQMRSLWAAVSTRAQCSPSTTQYFEALRVVSTSSVASSRSCASRIAT
ncbi:hypothetical protein AB1Y20_005413 [Prymnesium parvum]|uniref:Uncharacterized protein n=1 Tax=Prymnesium parvum TaxID=97485 RepID=A0AB34J5Q7_PRYPA